MCGIVGYIGIKKASEMLLKGLKKLEYRGYDSAGMAVIDGSIQIKKDIGKIDDVNDKNDFLKLEGNIGIAHSRWATHGKVTKKNAHPHISMDKKVAIVHNGIIENFDELKKELVKKDYRFESDTDSEVICNLIESEYKDDPQKAIINALKKVEGSYALGIIFNDKKDVLFAARNESPLVIGVGKYENFIASDVPAILSDTDKVIYLDNLEIAEITNNKIKIYGLDHKEIKKKIHEIAWDSETAEKQGYEDFMLKEIYEQPKAIEDTILGRIKDDKIDLCAEIRCDDLNGIKRIIFVACGTSWHSALVGEFMIEELTKIPVEVEYASEFRYRDPIIDKDTLVITISQSGETADTLAALREAKRKGCKILSIVNVEGSSIARESDYVLYTRAGPEIGVASTKAFISQLIVVYLFTIYLADMKGIMPEQQMKNRIRDLRLLPLQIQSVLDDKDYIELHAKHLYKSSNALYLGRGINYPIALEGALKLKEVSYIHAEGYPAAEMKHGPIALIDKKMPVFVIATKDDRTYKKVLSNIQEVKSRHGIVIAIATKADKEITKYVDHILYVPKNSYILSPLLAVIPLQMIAYYIAKIRGCNVDKPRNLAKSVTVE